jgi:hypothetical protein
MTMTKTRKKQIERLIEYAARFEPDDDVWKRIAAEHKRRRAIGKTIDLPTAETTHGWAVDIDPYDMRPPGFEPEDQYEEGQSECTMFARSPGGEWVELDDLPNDTAVALIRRDKRWGENGCIDDIFDALGYGFNTLWRRPSFEPCDAGVRVKLERFDDGGVIGIEFSLDDPDARRAVRKQLAAFKRSAAA